MTASTFHTHYFSRRTRLRWRTALAVVMVAVLCVDFVGALIVDKMQTVAQARVARLEANLLPEYELTATR